MRVITRASGGVPAASGPTAKRAYRICDGERQPASPRRLREGADAVRQRRQLLGLATLERHCPDLFVAQEEHAVALRRHLRRGVAHVA